MTEVSRRRPPAGDPDFARATGRRTAAVRAVAVGLLAVLLLTLPVTALAQAFLARYKAGVEAVERGDWSQVASHMRAAIAERPEEAPKLVAHFHFRPYLPHFYLGLALSRTGECEAALASFAQSEQQGVVQGQAEEWRQLQEARDRCRETLAANAQARQRAEAAVEAASSRLADVAALAGDADMASWWQGGSPSPRAQRGQAEEWLREARQALAEGDGDRARELAGRASEVLEELATAARAEAGRRQGQRARQEARSGLEATREAARRALASARGLRPYPDQVGRRVAEVERLLAQSEEEGLPLEELGRLEGALRQAAEALARTAAPPPAALLRAAEAHLAGRYSEVLEILADDELPRGRGQGRVLAHAHLLRAAAHFALDRAGVVPEEGEASPTDGASDGGLPGAAAADAGAGADADAPLLRGRAAARRELAAALQADPALRPSERFHSPAFRAFFDEVRNSAPPPPRAGAPR